MAPTQERLIKLLQDGKSSEDVGYSQSAVSKVWNKYKQNGKVVQEKCSGGRKRTS